VLGLLTRRLATAAITLFFATLIVFALINLAPGSPLGDSDEAISRARIAPEVRAELERHYRLDQPLVRRYLLWLGDIVRGDLGQSTYDRRPVATKILERLPVSFTLNTLALMGMVLLSVPIGAAAAFRPGSFWDRFSGLSSYALYAIPAFWAGLLLQIGFAVQLEWLPLSGLHSEGHAALGSLGRLADRAAHLVLPVTCLTYGGLAYLSRFVRATLLENASGENLAAARARGLSALGVFYRHGFRLAAVPMLTLAGFLLPALVGGSVIVETVFSIPGIGRLFVDAAYQRDYPVLMGVTLVSAVATLLGILAADLSYAWADPRTRRG